MRKIEVAKLESCPEEGFSPSNEKCDTCINYFICMHGGNEGLCYELNNKFLDDLEEG